MRWNKGKLGYFTRCKTGINTGVSLNFELTTKKQVIYIKRLITQIMKEKQEKKEKGKKDTQKNLKPKDSKRLVQLYRAGLRGYSLATTSVGRKFEK